MLLLRDAGIHHDHLRSRLSYCSWFAAVAPRSTRGSATGITKPMRAAHTRPYRVPSMTEASGAHQAPPMRASGGSRELPLLTTIHVRSGSRGVATGRRRARGAVSRISSDLGAARRAKKTAVNNAVCVPGCDLQQEADLSGAIGGVLTISARL